MPPGIPTLSDIGEQRLTQKWCNFRGQVSLFTFSGGSFKGFAWPCPREPPPPLLADVVIVAGQTALRRLRLFVAGGALGFFDPLEVPVIFRGIEILVQVR